MAEELRLELLGGMRITRNGVALDTFVSSKAPALLCYLAVSGRPQFRTALAGLLWSDLPEDAARSNLRVVLTNLRQALAPHLLVTRDTLAFDRAIPYWLDVEQVEAALNQSAPVDVERLRAAVALYTGDFLDGFSVRDAPLFDEWVVGERERLRQRVSHALHELVSYHIEHGAYTAGIDACTQLLQLDGWREDAHRQLMLLLAQSGQRTAALAAYERCRALLLAELGVEPEAETIRLAETIRIEQPQLARAPLPRSNLPAPLTPLIGREEELATLDALRQDRMRLITLLGPGGVGKSRLALAAASMLATSFADGVCWVALAGLAVHGDETAQLQQLARAVLDALGQPSPPQTAPLDALQTVLRPRVLLLVLDNCEHLPASGSLAAQLLIAAPQLVILATSRERLGIYGEELLRLGGLSVPTGPTERAAASEAVQLFLARARRQVRDFGSDPATLEEVAHLCRVLEGMPLGIELAAHWVGHYRPVEITAAIQSDLAFLEVTDRLLPDRQRSLRAVFDHSWQLLAAPEQRTVAQLSITVESFDRAAAQAVANAGPGLLAALVDKSLLRPMGAGRYSMHELLRQFAAEQLAARGEEAAARERHSAYYSTLALQLTEEKNALPRSERWRVLEREHRNLISALHWMRAHDQIERGIGLAAALVHFWRDRGHTSEGLSILADLVAQAGARPTSPQAQAQGYYAAALLADAQGDRAQARDWLMKSMQQYRALNDSLGVIRVLRFLGGVAFNRGDLVGASERWQEMLRWTQETPDSGAVASERVTALGNVGESYYYRGALDDAQQHYEAALALARELKQADLEAMQMGNLGNLARRRGEFEQAIMLQSRALRVWQHMGEQRRIAITLERLAVTLVAQGRVECGARLLGGATKLLGQLAVLPAQPEQRENEHIIQAGHAQLSETSWRQTFEAGAALSLEAILDDALMMSQRDE